MTKVKYKIKSQLPEVVLKWDQQWAKANKLKIEAEVVLTYATQIGNAPMALRAGRVLETALNTIKDLETKGIAGLGYTIKDLEGNV